jgi:predicted ATPase
MKSHPLRSFRLHNFKAIRDSGTLRFGPLTVFVGNNGSGKSSLIEGLETFRDVVLDGLDAAMNRWRGFEYVWNRAVKHELRRPAEERPHHTQPMAFRVDLGMPSYSLTAKQEINLGEGGNDLFIQREEVVWKEHREEHRITRDASGKRSVLWDSVVTPAPAEPALTDGRSILQPLISHHLERWQFLNLVPDQMGQPVPQQRAAGRIHLSKSGANIAEYLNDLRSRDIQAFNGLVDCLRYVLPFAEDLQPTLASELQREFYLKLKEEGFDIPGWLLSTGTLRVLALLACLRHPDPPTLLIVEEFENGLDQRTVNLLVEEIRTATTAGTSQVILTTHSPYVLDLLHLSHIVVVDRIEGSPRFSRPAGAEELREWAKKFSPGQLYTMGHLTERRQW